jgi:hypothetical protein
VVQRLPQREVAGGVTRGGRLREDLSGAHAQRPIDPDLVQSPPVIEQKP